MLPLPFQVSAVALFLIGVGNGPIFPNMLHITPQNFGEKISQSVMGVQMACSYIGIMLAPAIFGIIAQNVSVSIFPFFLLVFYLIMIIGSSRVSRVNSYLQ